MINRILFILSFFCFFLASNGQQKYFHTQEIGIFLGASYYTGDLNPTGHFNALTQPAAGAVFRYNFNPRLTARAHLFFGSIQGDDSRSESEAQQQRNLNFKSRVYELGLIGEFNFLEYSTGNKKYPFSPYIFLGVAGFNFNPQAGLETNWIALQPLGTEGQGTPASDEKKYKLTQISVPFGLGLKASLANRIGISVEWGLRKTFTDYLDDVSGVYADPAILAAYNGPNAALVADRSIGTESPSSNVGRQRGNSSNKDWYSFSGVVLSFKLKERDKPCHSYDY